jgi:hypothetical protein
MSGKEANTYIILIGIGEGTPNRDRIADTL